MMDAPIGEVSIRFPEYENGTLDHIIIRAYSTGAESMNGQQLTIAWVAKDGMRISPESLESEPLCVPEPGVAGLLAGALLLAAMMRHKE